MIKFILTILCLLSFMAPARAQQFDQHDFSQIPVQHGGRIKPLDTFARTLLKLFSGHESLPDMDADQWLAQMLFDPAEALHQPVFRILRPELLGLPKQESKYYAYVDLAPVLQQKSALTEKLSGVDEKNWTQDQRELMQLQENAILYTQILRSFSYVLPLGIKPPENLIKEWHLDANIPFTLQDYKRIEQRLQKRLKAVIRQKGEDPTRYNDDEKQLALFIFDMKILEQAGENNVLFRILPGETGGEKVEWFSPWAITQSGQGSPQTAFYLSLWKDLANAYLHKNTAQWKDYSRKILDASAAFTPQTKIKLEILYNTSHPLMLAMSLYLAAFVGFVFYGLFGTQKMRRTSLAVLSIGAVFHVVTILLRILILSRPPVGTLYESIIFVAAVCAIVAIALEFLKRDGYGILIGSLTGLLLLFIAQSFADDDTMTMLVAVLNTNFWLATHVLCITMGYGWCLIVSLLAHTWLVRTAMQKDSSHFLQPIKILTLIALLFTAVGTILGGIWADQSWGRFWGWDPKENGALLIVLWLVWILHAQISGHIKRDTSMALIAGLSIIVALSWFGVNLLSVGLHSYGFITGVAAGLGAFCAAELLLIGSLYYLIKTKRISA